MLIERKTNGANTQTKPNRIMVVFFSLFIRWLCCGCCCCCCYYFKNHVLCYFRYQRYEIAQHSVWIHDESVNPIEKLFVIQFFFLLCSSVLFVFLVSFLPGLLKCVLWVHYVCAGIYRAELSCKHFTICDIHWRQHHQHQKHQHQHQRQHQHQQKNKECSFNLVCGFFIHTVQFVHSNSDFSISRQRTDQLQTNEQEMWR